MSAVEAARGPKAVARFLNPRSVAIVASSVGFQVGIVYLLRSPPGLYPAGTFNESPIRRARESSS